MLLASSNFCLSEPAERISWLQSMVESVVYVWRLAGRKLLEGIVCQGECSQGQGLYFSNWPPRLSLTHYQLTEELTWHHSSSPPLSAMKSLLNTSWCSGSGWGYVLHLFFYFLFIFRMLQTRCVHQDPVGWNKKKKEHPSCQVLTKFPPQFLLMSKFYFYFLHISAET